MMPTEWTPERRRTASVKAKAPWTEDRRQKAAVTGKARWAALPDDIKAERIDRARAAGKARWAALPDYVKRERLAQRKANFAARYPWRVQLYADLEARIASGELIPEPCDRCGGEGRMRLAFDDERQTVDLVGWRCYPCRKAPPP